jgi:hypothetical protein
VSEPRAISVADLHLAPWTAEAGTEFETAEWILGALIAWCSARVADERARRHSDPARLAALDAERAEYVSARGSLSVYDPARVREVITRYGRLARERYRDFPDTHPDTGESSGPAGR